jgi:hypothetical protein
VAHAQQQAKQAQHAGLGALLDEHGLPHSTKDAVNELMREAREAVEAGG